MMGDTTISEETRDKVRRLCEKAGLPDKSGDFETEEAARAFMDDLQKRMQQRDTN
jgi:hypothetical protein